MKKTMTLAMTLLFAAITVTAAESCSTAKTASKTASNAARVESVQNTDRTTTVGKHRFIDMGLPSGLLWAETNIGADDATEPGTFYAWGETEAKEDYSWQTYKFGADYDKTFKYTDHDGMMRLLPADDAARAQWGGECRMPTFEEMQELADAKNCRWTWTVKKTPEGKKTGGYEVVSLKNGNRIFIPAAGAENGDDVVFRSEQGMYWTSTLAHDTSVTNGEVFAGNAFCMNFYFASVNFHFGDRNTGASIRPVLAVK